MDGPHRIIIDTDPGIDDALALLLAAASPEVEIVGVTVCHGNGTVARCTENALKLLDLAGCPGTPVAVGAERPLIRPLLTAEETHGPSGLGYADLPPPTRGPSGEHAVDLIIREVMAAPGEVTLMCIAPLTNLAMALRKEPRLAGAVRGVIAMGGALRHPGNTTPVAEFNVYCDPHAAHIVLTSEMPITLVSLDVTYRCILTRRQVEALQGLGGPVPQFVADSTRFYMEFHDEYQGIEGCAINDPLALALAFRPDLVTLEPVHVAVELASELTMGQTVADFWHLTPGVPNVVAAVEVDVAAFFSLFLERLASLTRKSQAAIQ